uniref:ULP_PROTEASE domain-containing protein n=1 Tax=Panagrellus redivivus TaxID=6233 RepID=A0A7E4W536_PANRE
MLTVSTKKKHYSVSEKERLELYDASDGLRMPNGVDDEMRASRNRCSASSISSESKRAANSDAYLAKMGSGNDPAFVTPISVDSAIDASVDPSTFVMLPPNIIVDPRLGVFADVTLNLANVCHFINDKEVLLRFIMNRTKAEELMLEVIQSLILTKALSLAKLSDVFREIFDCPKPPPPAVSKMSLLPKADSVKFHLIPEAYAPMRVDQSAILGLVFEPLRENSQVDKRWLSDVLLEFLLILKKARVVVDVSYFQGF